MDSSDGQGLHLDLRETTLQAETQLDRIARVQAQRRHDSRPLPEPAYSEGERPGGGGIEPLQVIEGQEQRTVQ
jgi:hypothetical protein